MHYNYTARATTTGEFLGCWKSASFLHTETHQPTHTHKYSRAQHVLYSARWTWNILWLFFANADIFFAFNFLYARYTFSTTAALLFYFIKSATTLIAHAGFRAQNKETLSNTGNCKFMVQAKGTQNNLLVKVIEADSIPLILTNIFNWILF
jgi:hypothetical protein